MGSIKYPLALFEIEESEDKCVIVSCFYEKLKVILSSLKSAPIVFVGVTEKWYQTRQGSHSFISPHILETAKVKLSDGSLYSSKSSVQLDISHASSNDSKQTIRLWGPPIETVSQTRGDSSEIIYVCLVNWISNQEINADTISEFGTKSVLLSICSRICEVTRGNLSNVETGLYDYLKHIRETDYGQQYTNILVDSFIHVVTHKEPYKGHLQGKDLPRCRVISLMDRLGTQFNIPEISGELADLSQLFIKKFRLKKMHEDQILNVGNVEDLLRSCVSSANSQLYFDALPTNLISFHEKMETDENVEGDPEPTIPIIKETLPVEQVKREYFKENWKADKSFAKIAQENLLKVQQAFQCHLHDWVASIKTLDAASEKEFKNLKRKVVNELGNDHDPDMLKEVAKNVCVIFQAAQEYVKELSKIFNINGYLSNDSLETAHENVLKSIHSRIDNSPQNTKTFVNQACRKLYKVIKGHNETILKYQQKIVKQSKSEVITMYTAELERFRKEKGPFPPKLFQKLSQALFMRCMAAFTKSTEYKGQSLKDNDVLKNELDDLAKTLMSLAEKQSKENKAEIEIQEQKTNEMALLKENERKARSRSQTPTKSVKNEKREEKQAVSPKRSQAHQTSRTRSSSRSTAETKADKEMEADKLKAKIKTIVQEHQTSYREEFKGIINSPNFKLETIRKEHVEIVRKTKKLFEMDVRNKIGEKVDVKNLWRNQMHSELEKVYQIFKESMQERKSENEEFKAKRNTERDGGGRAQQSHKEVSGKKDDDDLEIIKSPLVFQITEQKIGMAFSLNGSPNILTNTKNEKWTLNLVGQTHKGKMVYGDEVNEQAASERLRDKWEVGKMIEDGDVNRVGIFIDNATILVRVEILLGFLLKKLKIEAEKMVFHRDIKTCAICIPFFYTSMQRQQVVDSARVAGFESIQLLNDISALAYEYAVHVRKRPSEGVFMVITESSRNIKDAALYKYENGIRKGKACVEHQVRMLSHVGNYHEENESLKDLFLSAWKQLKNILAYSEMEEEKREQAKKSYKLIYNLIVHYHDNVLHKDCKRKKECIPDILQDVLKNSIIACRPGYATDFQRIIFDVSGKEPEVGSYETMLQGAARLSYHNPKKDGHSVLDLLSSSLWLTSGGNKMALGKGVELTRHSAKFHITSSSNNTIFFQKLFGTTEFNVISLHTKFELNTSFLGTPTEKLRVHFGVKNDGIFYLSTVELINPDSRKKIKTLQENEEYEIRNAFLKRQEVKLYRKYVIDFFKDSSD